MLRSTPKSWLSAGSVILIFALTLVSRAEAQIVPSAGPNQPAWMSFVPFVVMIGIMYVLMIRPQSKKAQAHKDFITKLERGDEVLTSGGLLGRVEGLTDTFVTLEISPGVRIKILRTQIASFLPKATETNNEVKA